LSANSTTDEATGRGLEALSRQGRRLSRGLISLREKLGRKAKQEPEFRFYTLYGHVGREDTLRAAWEAVRANGGAAGVDGVTIDQIADTEGHTQAFLEDIQQALQTRSYKPEPVRRVYIPKADGRQRPLGIPTIRDRVVQMAALLILEPIYEADFQDCSYGFRPGRNAHQALEAVQQALEQGCRQVYDADLKAYFDTIPQEQLLQVLSQRIADSAMLRLLTSWLQSTVVEKGKGGKRREIRPQAGTPQGGVISPLLANIYLNEFDRAFHSPKGPAQWAKARLVRYADDFVVLARYQGAGLTGFIRKTIEDRLHLQLHPDKTRIVNMEEEGANFDFLGYTFRYDRDRFGRSKHYLNPFPSKRALKRERQQLREMTDHRMCFKPIPILIQEINRHLRGWANYFTYGYPRTAYRHINLYTRLRLYQHLNRRSQRRYRPPDNASLYSHLAQLGLIYL
jgi:RNA-directed DNA polymerase